MDIVIIIGVLSSAITISVFVVGRPFLKDYLTTKKENNVIDPVNQLPKVEQITILKDSKWVGVINSDMIVESGYRITSIGCINGNVIIKSASIFINKGVVNGRIINEGGELINRGVIQ